MFFQRMICFEKNLKESLKYSNDQTDCFKSLYIYLGCTGLRLTLTEMIGDVIRNVDIPISPFAPFAASAGARVSIPFGLAVDCDVPFCQDGFIL